MKPLICLFSLILAFVASGIAGCTTYSDSCDNCNYNAYGKQYVKMNYEEPVIYCKYLRTESGVNYTVCEDCDGKRCVKEYHYSCGRKC